LVLPSIPSSLLLPSTMYVTPLLIRFLTDLML
jgi:hypothetical protein